MSYSGKKSYTTALAITLPDEFVAQVNKIRSKHDKAFPRWMPHVNLLFPFIPVAEFQRARLDLQNSLNKKEIQIEFSQLNSFPHGNIHCAPTIIFRCERLFSFFGCQRRISSSYDSWTMAKK